MREIRIQVTEDQYRSLEERARQSGHDSAEALLEDFVAEEEFEATLDESDWAAIRQSQAEIANGQVISLEESVQRIEALHRQVQAIQ